MLAVNHWPGEAGAEVAMGNPTLTLPVPVSVLVDPFIPVVSSHGLG
jgi:hypothetical protein